MWWIYCYVQENNVCKTTVIECLLTSGGDARNPQTP